MQTRARVAIALVATAVVAAAGVAGVTRYRRGAGPAHAIDAIPSGALLVATADSGGAPGVAGGRSVPP